MVAKELTDRRVIFGIGQLIGSTVGTSGVGRGAEQSASSKCTTTFSENSGKVSELVGGGYGHRLRQAGLKEPFP